MNSLELSRRGRVEVLNMVHRAKASHIGGALSMMDILAVLYTDVLNIDPANPQGSDRDRFFLSKGHACTALYAILGLKGFYSLKELETYSQNDSRFLSHTSHKVPGVELSTGSLGHALSVACGQALSAKLNKKKWHTVALLSDGELNEGSNWEAILFAPHHKLDNLTLIIDYNKIQSLGRVEEVIGLESLKAKFEAFNWNTVEIDGHNHDEIRGALKWKRDGLPAAIIAHTVKGKGVDFMEDKLLWHYKSPSDQELEHALTQLNNK